jgi:hypothetical protein
VDVHCGGVIIREAVHMIARRVGTWIRRWCQWGILRREGENSLGGMGGSKFFQNFSEFGTLTREGATGTFSADARGEQTWKEESDQISLLKKR